MRAGAIFDFNVNGAVMPLDDKLEVGKKLYNGIGHNTVAPPKLNTPESHNQLLLTLLQKDITITLIRVFCKTTHCNMYVAMQSELTYHEALAVAWYVAHKYYKA